MAARSSTSRRRCAPFGFIARKRRGTKKPGRAHLREGGRFGHLFDRLHRLTGIPRALGRTREQVKTGALRRNREERATACLSERALEPSLKEARRAVVRRAPPEPSERPLGDQIVQTRERPEIRVRIDRPFGHFERLGHQRERATARVANSNAAALSPAFKAARAVPVAIAAAVSPSVSSATQSAR